MSAPTLNRLDRNVGITNIFNLNERGIIQNFGQKVINFFDPTAALPANPTDGDFYISLATANGWVNNYLEYYDSYLATWKNIEPIEGNTVWVDFLGEYRFWDPVAVAWVSAAAILDTIPIAPPSTDKALVRWNGVAGNAVQNSVGILSDAGDLSGLTSQTLTSVAANPGGANTLWSNSAISNRYTIGADPIALSPITSTDNAVARYNGTSGKLQDSTMTVNDVGDVYIPGKLTVVGLIDPSGLELDPVAANPGGVGANTIWLDSGASNRITIGASPILRGGTTFVDNAILRYDGTNGLTQSTNVLISDANAISGVGGVMSSPTGITFTSQGTNPGTSDTIWLHNNGSVRNGSDTMLKAPATITNNVVPRFDNTNQDTLQLSGITISNGNVIGGTEGLNLVSQGSNPGDATTLWNYTGNTLYLGYQAYSALPDTYDDNSLLKVDLMDTSKYLSTGLIVSDTNLLSGPIGITLTAQGSNPGDVGTLWYDASSDLRLGNKVINQFREVMFISSGSITIPANAYNVMITLWGGGGGGGGGEGSNAITGGGGGGGGSGGEFIVNYPLPPYVAGYSMSYTVGLGGIGGSGGIPDVVGEPGGSGANGGDTSITVHTPQPHELTAIGGIGGSGGAVPFGVGTGGLGALAIIIKGYPGSGYGGAGGAGGGTGAGGNLGDNGVSSSYGGGAGGAVAGSGGGGGGGSGYYNKGSNGSTGGSSESPLLSSGAGGGGGSGGLLTGAGYVGNSGGNGGIILRYFLI